MKHVTKHEISSNFLDILEVVQNGEDIIVTGNKGQKKLAVILPYGKYRQKTERVLGSLKGKATYKIKDDFKITDEELLSL